ncbi:MAG: hypothetical protein BIFFINMI_03155 [Phycisphaerae bacterium]|nr:hypothetical protein [Phycisphaerae bacterium]
MSDRQFLILAYAIALGLMWGYAAILWAGLARLRAKSKR